MKTRRFLFVMALIGIILACDWGPQSYSSTNVKSVAVTPPSGPGSFTLEVTYVVFTNRAGHLPEPITCYYVTPAGATVMIGFVNPPEYGQGGGTTLTGTLPLSVSDPGVYTATCENNSSTSKASAVFGVTDPPGQGQNEPPPPPANPPPANPPPEQPAGPITVTGTGKFIYLSKFPTTDTCTVPADFSLTVEADGIARLAITYNGIDTVFNSGSDIIHCTHRPEKETISLVGYVNATEGKTVSFNNNEPGLLPCQGTFSFADGVLSGEMLCSDPGGGYGYKWTVP